MAQIICPTPGSQLIIDEPTGILGISPMPSLPPINSWPTPVITLPIVTGLWIDWSNEPHLPIRTNN